MADDAKSNDTDTPDLGTSPTPPLHPLQEILDVRANRSNLRTLVTLLQSKGKGVLPFVGAGLSKPYGFPIWRDFLLENGENEGVKAQIEVRIANGEYEEAAADLFNKMGPFAFHNAIDEEYGVHKLEGKQIKGSHAHLVKIAAGPVITTNFDRVLETAFEQAQSEFKEKVWGARAKLLVNALNHNERMLLKIHGDVKDTTDRILTQEEYQTHYGGADGLIVDMDKPLPKLLHLMLLGRPLLFVGCSLNNDRTIKVMKKIADAFQETSHWAIVEMPKVAEDLAVRHRFLNDHNIRPIWYPYGEHEWVEKILKYLADQVNPS